ncbi:MAG: hypothetical protein GY906_23175 [bacterium]|nr:hypothetical protein [bacterium]
MLEARDIFNRLIGPDDWLMYVVRQGSSHEWKIGRVIRVRERTTEIVEAELVVEVRKHGEHNKNRTWSIVNWSEAVVVPDDLTVALAYHSYGVPPDMVTWTRLGLYDGEELLREFH